MKKTPPLVFICFLIAFSVNADDVIPFLVKKIQPSVVMITTYDSLDKPLMKGTGFIINSEGDVVSNNHVLEGAIKAAIKTSDGKIYYATKILAVDIKGDLVCISCNIPHGFAKPLTVTPLLPVIGEKIIVIGNPAGFEQTVSDGIISSIRKIPNFGYMLQITAPISQGSSGSPVVNLKGEIIGVASLISTEGQNLNFAIPGERILKISSLNVDAQGFKNTKEAINTEFQLLNTNPFTNIDDILSLGWQKFIVNQRNEAVDLFSQALQKDNRNVTAYYYRSLVYYSIGQYNNALTDINCAISLNKTWAPLYGTRADILSNDMNNDKNISLAIADYSTSIELDTMIYESYLGRAIIYSETGRLENAILDFNNALAIAPKTEKGHILLKRCDAYVSFEKYSEAIKDITQAIEYFKKYPCSSIAGLDFTHIAYEERANIFEKTNDYSNAISDYKKILPIIESNKAFEAYIQNENIAIKNLLVYGVHQRIAFVYHNWGKSDSAVKYLSSLISYGELDDSKKGDFYYSLRAENYAKMGKLHDAIADYTYAMKFAKYSSDKLRYILARGELLLEMNRYEEALKDFEVGSDYWRMINVYEITGKDSSIINVCNLMLREKREPTKCYYSRGKAYYRMKNYSAAETDLKSFIQLVRQKITASSSNGFDFTEAKQTIIECEQLITKMKE